MIARGQLKKSQAVLSEEREKQKAERERIRRIRSQMNEISADSEEAQQSMRERVKAEVDANPAAAADIIKGWISG